MGCPVRRIPVHHIPSFAPARPEHYPAVPRTWLRQLPHALPTRQHPDPYGRQLLSRARDHPGRF